MEYKESLRFLSVLIDRTKENWPKKRKKIKIKKKRNILARAMEKSTDICI